MDLQSIQDIEKLNEQNKTIEELKEKLEQDISDQSVISENSSEYFEEK